jgi:hypothetical protein
VVALAGEQHGAARLLQTEGQINGVTVVGPQGRFAQLTLA